MGKKIYVGNISFKATEQDVKEFFSKMGDVESVKLITDPNTGQCRGFGFVEMASEEDAKKAIESLNGTAFMERTLSIAEARPQRKEKRFDDRRGGGGGGGQRRGGGQGRGWR
jgi:RNA recognition motif-containing protein